MSDLRDWKGYNEALVKRGLIFIDLDFIANWSRELKAMNAGKEAGRYCCPGSFIKLLSVVHAYVLTYRQLKNQISQEKKLEKTYQNIVLDKFQFFFSSLEEENLFFQKSSAFNLGLFSDLGLGMGLGCVEKCRNMSKKVDCF
jgi:hypothetical protein